MKKCFAILLFAFTSIVLYGYYNNDAKAASQQKVKYVPPIYTAFYWVESDNERAYNHPTVMGKRVNMFLPDGKPSRTWSYIYLINDINFQRHYDSNISSVRYFPRFKLLVEQMHAMNGFDPSERTIRTPTYVAGEGNRYTIFQSQHDLDVNCQKNKKGQAVDSSLIFNLAYIGCLECIAYLQKEWKQDINVKTCSGMTVLEYLGRKHSGLIRDLQHMGYDFKSAAYDNSIAWGRKQDGSYDIRTTVDLVYSGWFTPVGNLKEEWDPVRGQVAGNESCDGSYNGVKYNRCAITEQDLLNFLWSKGYASAEEIEGKAKCNTKDDLYLSDEANKILRKYDYVDGVNFQADLDGDDVKEFYRNREEYLQAKYKYQVMKTNRYCTYAYYMSNKKCNAYGVSCDMAKLLRPYAMRTGFSDKELDPYLERYYGEFFPSCNINNCGSKIAAHDKEDDYLFPSANDKVFSKQYYRDMEAAGFKDASAYEKYLDQTIKDLLGRNYRKVGNN